MSDFTYAIPFPYITRDVLRCVIKISAKVVAGLKVLKELISTGCAVSS